MRRSKKKNENEKINKKTSKVKKKKTLIVVIINQQVVNRNHNRNHKPVHIVSVNLFFKKIDLKKCFDFYINFVDDYDFSISNL